jgi:hypothetical protein
MSCERQFTATTYCSSTQRAIGPPCLQPKQSTWQRRVYPHALFSSDKDRRVSSVLWLRGMARFTATRHRCTARIGSRAKLKGVLCKRDTSLIFFRMMQSKQSHRALHMCCWRARMYKEVTLVCVCVCVCVSQTPTHPHALHEKKMVWPSSADRSCAVVNIISCFPHEGHSSSVRVPSDADASLARVSNFGR